MAISAKDVQKLREMTGVGMMDCKKALTATEGDFDKAIEFLREKGLATATKKAGRIAAEGMAYGHCRHRRGQQARFPGSSAGVHLCRFRHEGRRQADRDDPGHRREHQGSPLPPVR